MSLETGDYGKIRELRVSTLCSTRLKAGRFARNTRTSIMNHGSLGGSAECLDIALATVEIFLLFKLSCPVSTASTWGEPFRPDHIFSI